MNLHGKTWHFSIVDMLGFATSIAVMVFWVSNYFQTKEEAAEYQSAINLRMESLEKNMSDLRSNLTDIRADVSYIRGRLEPQPK